MQPNASSSIEISIALLSWINDQLKDSTARRPKRERISAPQWLKDAGTFLAAGFFGLCMMILQHWS